MDIEKLFKAIDNKRYTLSNEKTVQIQLLQHMKQAGFEFQREVRLDENNIIDFLDEDGVGIEVKVNGSRMAILHQCERYCKFDQIKIFILISSKAMGFPKELNGKPCYFFNLSRAVL